MKLNPPDSINRLKNIDLVLEETGGLSGPFMNFISPRLIKVSGYQIHEIFGRPFPNMFIPSKRIEAVDKIRQARDSGQALIVNLPLLRSDGVKIQASWGLKSLQAARYSIAVSLLTVTRHGRVWTTDCYISDCDYLTGLPQRRIFLSSLEDTIEETLLLEEQMAVLIIKMDFMPLWDIFGPSDVERFLKSFSSKLVNVVSDDDTVTRLGENEIAIIFKRLKDKRLPRKIENLIESGRVVIEDADNSLELPVKVELVAYPSVKKIRGC